MEQTQNLVSFENFFDNSGIDNLISTIEKVLSKYDDSQVAEELDDLYELDVIESLVDLNVSLENIKKMSSKGGTKKSLESQLNAMRELIVSHQAVLRTYTQVKDEESQKELSSLIHGLNIIYPLFVIGLVYKDNETNQNKTEEE